MSKHRVAVLKVVSKHLSVTAAAAVYGMSRQHLQRLLARYRDGGLEALEPRSRRPLTSPQRTPDEVRARIVELRMTLTARGLDAGPVTIAWHLGREGQGSQLWWNRVFIAETPGRASSVSARSSVVRTQSLTQGYFEPISTVASPLPCSER